MSVVKHRALRRCAWLFAIVLLASEAPAFGQDALVTFDDIKRISPNAKAEFVQAFVDLEPEFEAAGITTRLRMAHFIAQVMTETGGLARLDENMNYSFKTLMRVFKRKTISEAKAHEIAGNAKAIANWVYGDRLGNLGRNTNDGWNYRGSGHIQLTGRFNFRARGADAGLPLEDQPDLARQAREGLLVAIAYWKANKVNAAADDNDQKRVRIKVNGPAAHGLDQAKVWFKTAWNKVFANKEDSGFEMGQALDPALGIDEAALFDQMLEDGGLFTPGTEASGDVAAARSAALRELQQELDLPVTGALDEATRLALLDPREWRYSDLDSEQPVGPSRELDQTTVFVVAEAGAVEAGGAILEGFESTAAPLEGAKLGAGVEARLAAATATYAPYETGPVSRDGWVPQSVIKPDTRKVQTPTTGFPARAIVEILFKAEDGREHLCSGAMISKDTVLTAGHCVHTGTTNGVLHTGFVVIPGRNLGAFPFGSCGVRKIFVLNGWAAAVNWQEGRYYDMAALKLDCTVGEITGWIGVRALDDTETELETSVQGYSADRPPFGRQWLSKDHVRLLWSLKGFYQNDTYGGTSGAPVFPSGETPLSIVGVHTNGLHGSEQPWSENNAFTRITAERLALIRQWVAD